MGQAAITAAQGTYAQLQSIGLTSATVGVTPMVFLNGPISPLTLSFLSISVDWTKWYCRWNLYPCPCKIVHELCRDGQMDFIGLLLVFKPRCQQSHRSSLCLFAIGTNSEPIRFYLCAVFLISWCLIVVYFLLSTKNASLFTNLSQMYPDKSHGRYPRHFPTKND